VNGLHSERPTSITKTSKTLDEVRSDACNIILAVFTLLAAIATAANTLRTIDVGWKPVMALHVVLTLALAFTTLRRHSLSLNVRAAIVTAVPFIIAMGGLLTYGRGNGVLMFLVTTSVLAGCFFNLRVALSILAGCIGALAVVYLGYRAEVLALPVNPTIYDMTPLSWLTLGFAVLVAGAAPLVGISALLRLLDTERARADEAARARSDFLASISHELRTPLAHIIGMAEVLKGTALDAHQRDLIAETMLSGRNLLSVLNSLLDFTQYENGAIPLEARPFRLADEIGEICAPFEGKAAAKGLHLGIELAPDLPEDVVGDRLRFGQALSNLLDNAVKFTTTGGVLVRVWQAPRDDGKLMLSCMVMDTGIGVAAADAARIFDPFFQADMSASRLYGGSGLGLSITRALAAAMGGDVTVTTELGAGSTFTLRVLLERGAPPQPVDSSVSAPWLGAGGTAARQPLRLLLADDDVHMRTVAEIMLEERGHAVTLVEDGAAAVAAAGSNTYDCIILDMHMPVLSGIGAIRALRATEAATGARRQPIIAISADVVPEHVRDFIEAGADAFISKPVGWDALEAKIQELTTRAAAAVEPVS